MSSSGNWTMEENIQLCESWYAICHDPITGNNMRKENMWKEIKETFESRCTNTSRTDQAIQNHWKHLVKEFNAWRHAIKEANAIVPPSGTNMETLRDTIQTFYKLKMKTGKNFINQPCWEVVKYSPRFAIETGTPIHINASELGDMPGEDSPAALNLSDDDPPIRVTRPEGRRSAKAAKAARKKTPVETAKFFEQIALQSAMNLEENRARETAKAEALLIRQDQALKMEQRAEEFKIMSMDTSNMSPLTSKWWKQKRREVIGRSLFREDDPNTSPSGETSTPQSGRTRTPQSGGTNYPPVEHTDWMGQHDYE